MSARPPPLLSAPRRAPVPSGRPVAAPPTAVPRAGGAARRPRPPPLGQARAAAAPAEAAPLRPPPLPTARPAARATVPAPVVAPVPAAAGAPLLSMFAPGQIGAWAVGEGGGPPVAPLVDGRSGATYWLAAPFTRGTFGLVGHACDAAGVPLVYKELVVDAAHRPAALAVRLSLPRQVETEAQMLAAVGGAMAPRACIVAGNRYFLLQRPLRGDVDGLMAGARAAGLDVAAQRLLARSFSGQAAAQLRRLQGQGFVFGDFKGANVGVDEGGRAQLNDFGMTRLTDPLSGRVAGVRGSPSYMAPEVVAARGYDGRAEVWAAAVAYGDHFISPLNSPLFVAVAAADGTPRPAAELAQQLRRQFAELGDWIASLRGADGLVEPARLEAPAPAAEGTARRAHLYFRALVRRDPEMGLFIVDRVLGQPLARRPDMGAWEAQLRRLQPAAHDAAAAALAQQLLPTAAAATAAAAALARARR